MPVSQQTLPELSTNNNHHHHSAVTEKKVIFYRLLLVKKMKTLKFIVGVNETSGAMMMCLEFLSFVLSRSQPKRSYKVLLSFISSVGKQITRGMIIAAERRRFGFNPLWLLFMKQK
jgi:hypothetical protein